MPRYRRRCHADAAGLPMPPFCRRHAYAFTADFLRLRRVDFYAARHICGAPFSSLLFDAVARRHAGAICALLCARKRDSKKKARPPRAIFSRCVTQARSDHTTILRRAADTRREVAKAESRRRRSCCAKMLFPKAHDPICRWMRECSVVADAQKARSARAKSYAIAAAPRYAIRPARYFSRCRHTSYHRGTMITNNAAEPPRATR